MEKCIICGGEQDSRHYENYNICTECFDIMEDLMGEYFLRTIKYGKPKARESYIRYIENSIQYVSDYIKIRRHSRRHVKYLEGRIKNALDEMKEDGSRQRYLERLLLTLNWLKEHPEFYNYYFKDYYVCPNCKVSIFEKYNSHKVGDWLMISCANCDTVIKKYFSPKLV
ncbi:MAG: hypothetical protein ACE5KE_10860 [Methanosarcinales archaeon]